MPAPKRAATANGDAGEPVKRRSTRQAAAAAAAASTVPSPQVEESVQPTGTRSKKITRPKAEPKPKATPPKPKAEPKTKATPRASKPTKVSKDGGDAGSGGNDGSSRAPSPDLDPESIPRINPDAVRHEGQWYWLMKAEPESRFENGIDVRFSIDDLRACTEPEGWDGNVKLESAVGRGRQRILTGDATQASGHMQVREGMGA